MTSFLKSPLLDKFEDAEMEIERRIARETTRRKSSVRLSISSSDLLPSDLSDNESNRELLITPSILPPGGRHVKGGGGEGNVSTRTAYANVIKAYLGSGLLAIPYAFRCGGFLSGTIGLLVLALISNTTLKMLIWMRRRFAVSKSGEEITFSSIGMYSTGKWGRRLALFAELATNVGIAIGYLVFIGNTALIVLGVKSSDSDDDEFQIHHEWLDSGTGSFHLNLIIVACAVPLFLFSQLRSMRKMGFVSIMGNFAVAFAIIVVTYTSISTVSWNEFPSFPPNRDVDWTIRLAKMPYFFGIAMFSFTIHGIVLPIEASMKHPEDAYKMFDRCTLFVALSYVVFGGTLPLPPLFFACTLLTLDSSHTHTHRPRIYCIHKRNRSKHIR